MTTRLALIVIGVLWLGWLVYWFVSARDAKANRWREPRLAELRHRVPVWIAAFLFIARPALRGVLTERFVPVSAGVLVVCILVVAAGLGLAIWARVHLGRNWSGSVTVKQEHAFVTSGPYAHVRHPIYSGILLALLGTALAIGDWRALAGFVLVFVAFIIKSRTEERRMRETFADYENYRRRTAALIPFVF